MAFIQSRPDVNIMERVSFTGDDIEDPYDKINTEIKLAMYGCLQMHYPGHPWGTECKVQDKYALVRMPSFTDQDWILHHPLHFSPNLIEVVRAGGNFLERYSIPRSPFTLAEWHRVIQADPLGYQKRNNVPG